MRRALTFAGLAAALALAPCAASATVMVLGFERVNATYPTISYARILNFYNGGTSNQATTGTNCATLVKNAGKPGAPSTGVIKWSNGQTSNTSNVLTVTSSV